MSQGNLEKGALLRLNLQAHKMETSMHLKFSIWMTFLNKLKKV